MEDSDEDPMELSVRGMGPIENYTPLNRYEWNIYENSGYWEMTRERYAGNTAER